MKRTLFILVLTALGLAGQSPVPAQVPLSNLVFATGTTIQANGGQNWSYVLLGSETPALLAGKTFAVYGKNGFATNSATFTLRGTIFPQTSVAAISVLLSQALVLRDDQTSLSNALNVALHNIPGATNWTLPQKLSTALTLANTDPDMRGTIALLGRSHPSVLLCCGLAFSEAINSVTTYELREVAPATGAAGDAVGRITIEPGNPVILPAPGIPFQVTTAGAPVRDQPTNEVERIKIYLRWGTPPELRRLGLLSYGFNVWRMPVPTAQLNHFDATPPSLDQLYTNATLANDAPVMAIKDFPANLPGDPADTTTFFFADDNGRRSGLPLFADGAQYYYFVTARDLLGRDGYVSPGVLATACRRLPPGTPSGLKVKNVLATVSVGGVNTNQSRLLLTWPQITDTNQNVTAYWVYLWDNPAETLTNDPTQLSHRIGVVNQLSGTNANQFLVDGNSLPAAASVSNYWFTVRAVSQAACGPLYSAHSAPAWGVLREREGPKAATGEILGNCGTPVVAFQNFNLFTTPANTNNHSLNFRLTCQRRDSAIAWVMFTLTSTVATNTIGPVQFPPEGNTVSMDVSLPNTYGTAFVTNQIVCLVGDFEDNNSTPATNYLITDTTVTNYGQEAVFIAGEILLNSLSSADPLLSALNGYPSCSETYAVTPYPDGTVSMRFAVGGNVMLPRMVQVLTSNTWEDVGVAWPDTNHVYWVSYPACLIGPLPTFRGCVVNVPNTGDCDQHISSVDSTISPIIVRFRPTFRSREYRLYRRANDGPAVLIASGQTTFDPLNSSRSIVIPDDNLPPSAAQLCYYVQMLDEHGNGGPLAALGCKYSRPAVLPRPVLAEPHYVGDAMHPQVLLNWFCPTSGVHRFEIKIHREDPTTTSAATGFGSVNLLHLTRFNPKKSYAGLYLSKAKYWQPDEVFVTTPIGTSFGPGPQFTFTADVLRNATYSVTVAVMDEHDKVYNDSEPQTFTWNVPATNILSVPWPARPLPPVTHFDDENGSSNYRVAAVILRYNTGNAQTFLDARYPVGIRIGDLATLSQNFDITYLTTGTTNFFTYRPITYSSSLFYGLDPVQMLYTRNSANPQLNHNPLLPLVVYRVQTTNATFPKVSGSITQVTPLIEAIPHLLRGHSDTTTVVVPDLLVGTGFESDPINFQAPAASNSHIYIRDQQPVLIGATYHYYVVRFNAKHEVAETIDAGSVTIPPN